MKTDFFIVCDREVIGTSALEERDASMGIASGDFAPRAAYERVRGVFRLYSNAFTDTSGDRLLIESYYAARDKLGLTVTTRGGELVPTSVVHIADFFEEADSYLVEVHIEDPAWFIEND